MCLDKLVYIPGVPVDHGEEPGGPDGGPRAGGQALLTDHNSTLWLLHLKEP